MVRNSISTNKLCNLLREQSLLLKRQAEIITEMLDVMQSAPYEEEAHMILVAEAVAKSTRGVVLQFPTNAPIKAK